MIPRALRRALLAGGAAIGAAATLNALAKRGVPPLENLIGGDPGWFTWRGRRVFYSKRTARQPGGSPLLLVHGIHTAAWSYEWRSNADVLSYARDVYALDLLGFGVSDRPRVRYSARLYLRLIDDFARQVIGGPVTLVASSLSAAYATVLGARDPGQYPSLVLIEPTGLVRRHDAASTGGDVARAIVDAPLVGAAVFNTLSSRRSLRYWLERAYVDLDFVTPELVDIYHRAAHQPGARYAPSAFLSGHMNLDVRGAVRRLRQPVMLVWGEQAVETPVEDARGFLALNSGLQLTILDPAGMIPQDEQAAEFNAVVTRFLSGG
ncbi:MAG: alpha/beta fold hydrolase [Gemmatimonadaceae bacterium]